MAKKNGSNDLKRPKTTAKPRPTPRKTRIDPEAEKETVDRLTRRTVIAGLGLGLLPALKADSDAPLDEAVNSPGFVSVYEGVEIYQGLKRHIKAKLAQARKEGKPLRIFLLDAHDRPDSLAYELMVLQIANSLGIGQLLIEMRAPQFSDYERLSHNADVQPKLEHDYEMKKFAYLIHDATERGYNVGPMDTLYASSEGMEKALDALTVKLAEAAVREHFPVKNLKISIASIPNGDLEGGYKRNYTVDFDPPLPPSAQPDIDAIILHARKHAVALQVEERNEAMLSVIRKNKDAVMVAGMRHGMGLIEPLRREGGVDATFTLFDPSLVLPLREDLQDPFSNRLKQQQLIWPLDHANAVQCASVCQDKNFDPRKVVAFVDRVIEKANSTGLFR